MLGVCVVYSLAAQSTVIQWSNPSFEDIPGPGRPPLGWYFCGPPEETPPDVQPVALMNVTQRAIHGKTYAGLVVRDNNTQETLGQSLEQPLQKDSCYLLRFYACRSKSFASYSRLTGEPMDFSEPVKLQIWAGDQHCQRKLLLVETQAIRDTNWREYEVRLQPSYDCSQLFFSATYYNTGKAYNGHLLIDHLSPIVPASCNGPAEPRAVPVDYGGGSENADLSRKVQEKLAGIRWERNGFSLHQEFFTAPGSSGQWIAGNRAIYEISQYLKAVPDALLTVAVGPRKDPLVQHHIRLLAAEFMAAGLPPERCLIRPMKKRDLKKEDWLNAPDEPVDVLWGLSYQ
ncbi:hypothetical protein CRP01_35560 [Flavilitoribacter nigricans DSM 23189 = NBRC 102662]|uniref:CBM-cenC domain-containing protein n=2 Tax=Flavilitoribacter TaxID=2762562 RepID=A0A2D0MZT3_FLAN2|nr:hypothetical protein CRP01_35560 [Flavilitoribacter nigricans DSM 23189 = NBRC 102662]